MKQAGFIGFERGERGSTAEHLSVEEYKTQKERERAAVYAAIAGQKQEAAAVLDTNIAEKSKKSAAIDKIVEKKQEKLNDLTEKTAAAEKIAMEYEEIEKLGHKRTIFGGVTLSGDMWTKILKLVKEALNSRKEIKELKAEIRYQKGEVKVATEAFEQQKAAYIRLAERVQPYLDAVKLFPQQVKETISQYLDLGRKQQEQRRLEQLQREQAVREQQKLQQQQFQASAPKPRGEN